jgi:hypothetical protein
MIRHIVTFANLHQVLSAEKALRQAPDQNFPVRPTSTPPGLDEAICGMSIEVLDGSRLEEVVNYLNQQALPPRGVHEVEA